MAQQEASSQLIVVEVLRDSYVHSFSGRCLHNNSYRVTFIRVERKQERRLNTATSSCRLLNRQSDLTRGRKRKTEFCRNPLRAAISLHRQTRIGLDQLDLCTNHSPIRVSFLCLLVDSSHLQDRHSIGQIQLRSFHVIMVLNPRLGHRFDLNYY